MISGGVVLEVVEKGRQLAQLQPVWQEKAVELLR